MSKKDGKYKTAKGRCAVCIKCTIYIDGPFKGSCIYGGPFYGYCDEQGNDLNIVVNDIIV